MASKSQSCGRTILSTIPGTSVYTKRRARHSSERHQSTRTFTEAENWDELRASVLEAVALHFEDATTRPRLVRMHYVKDELIPVEAA